MSVNAENATNASEPYDAEKISGNNDCITLELNVERIWANL